MLLIEAFVRSWRTKSQPLSRRLTFISMAARLGLPRNIVKKLVNHIAGLDATDGYIVLQADDLREPMQRITDRFLELMGCDLSDWQEEKSCISCAHICPCVKVFASLL